MSDLDGKKRYKLKNKGQKVRGKIRDKSNCCGEVEQMYAYLEELRAWCDELWMWLRGSGGGSPPPPPPSWP